MTTTTRLSNFKQKTSPAVFLIVTYLLLAFVLTPLAVMSGIQAFEIIVTLINILACVVFFYKIFQCKNVNINLAPLKKFGL